MMDVAIMSAVAGSVGCVNAAARRDGKAAERGVVAKRNRYGQEVVPFVLEVGGRPSLPARQWVRKVISFGTQEGEHPLLGATAWQMISCTLQRYVALQLTSAESL